MDDVNILQIKPIEAGIVFVAFALIVIVGYSLGPYLSVVSPHDGKVLILASHVSFLVMIVTAISVIYSIIRHKKN